MTSSLVKRAYLHKADMSKFTTKYQCKMLVYYEIQTSMHHAITREKQIKAGSRRKKLSLIAELNPNWEDLFDKIAI